MSTDRPRRLALADQRWQLGPLTEEEILSLPAMVEFVDAARSLGFKRQMAYELARQGAFPVQIHRHGRLLKVRRVDLLAYLGIGSGSSPRNHLTLSLDSQESMRR